MLLNPPKWNAGGKKECISLACRSFVGLCPAAALGERLQREESKCTREMLIRCVL